MTSWYNRNTPNSTPASESAIPINLHTTQRTHQKLNNNMKRTKISLIIPVIVLAMGACSKHNGDNTKVVTATVPASNPIAPGNVSGFVKGTFTTGNTYTITGDLTLKAGDTLASQQGVTVIVANNAQITVFGVLNLVGTQASPIEFNSSSKLPGSWGGFDADSAQAVTIKWAHIDKNRGPDPT